MKKIVIPIHVIRFTEKEKLKDQARLILMKNEDIDVIHFEWYGKITSKVQRKDCGL